MTPFYGVTIVSNKIENYKDDSIRIGNAWNELAIRGYYDVVQGWEVQPNGRHLLHVHILAVPLTTCKEKQPFFSPAQQKALGVSVKIEKINSLAAWTKYIRKSPIDAIWNYQQHHCDLLAP